VVCGVLRCPAVSHRRPPQAAVDNRRTPDQALQATAGRRSEKEQEKSERIGLLGVTTLSYKTVI